MNLSAFHQPSGLNDHFHGNAALPFTDYIEKTRQMIASARVDLTSSQAELILNANSPRQWPTTTPTPQQGLLLIHGLYDSPFLMADLGDYFAKQGLLVRSILLPGHGTVPGDLLNVQYEEWLKAVDYGVETLSQEVEQVFLLGFSLGGLLALHQALNDQRIQGLLLLSPALEIQQQRLVAWLLRINRFAQWLLPHQPWYLKHAFQKDYARYESFTYNTAWQIYQLLLKTHRCLARNTLSIPAFFAVSAEDEAICPTRCLDFFKPNTHPQNRLLWYARNHTMMEDARITVKSSVFPARKILDFSHICLPVSFDNPHYGQRGDYRNFLIYPENKAPLYREIFLGATSRENQKKGVIQRLTYNPDFEGMVQEMRDWLKCRLG